MKCSMCNSTNISQHTEFESITYKKTPIQVSMQYSLCGGCGHEFVSADQIKLNDKAVLAAKRKADGLLSPNEIRLIRKELSLTQAQAAQAFGGGRNAFSKYERGEVAQSEAMDKLLRLVQQRPSLLVELVGASAFEESNVVYVDDWQSSESVGHLNSFAAAGSTVIASVEVEQEQRYG